MQDVESPEVLRFRGIWNEYDELKRVTTKLGCEMLKTKQNPCEVEDLCEQALMKLARIRHIFREKFKPS